MRDTYQRQSIIIIVAKIKNWHMGAELYLVSLKLITLSCFGYFLLQVLKSRRTCTLYEATKDCPEKGHVRSLKMHIFFANYENAILKVTNCTQNIKSKKFLFW